MDMVAASTTVSQHVSCLDANATPTSPASIPDALTHTKAVGTCTSAQPVASASICAVAVAIRSPVNPPGPIDTPTSSKSAGAQFAAAANWFNCGIN
jgi:hypothetical protein